MIQTSHSEILAGNMAPNEGIRARVPIVKVRKVWILRAPQAKKGQDRFVDSSRRIGIGSTGDVMRRATRARLWLRTQDSLSGCHGGNCNSGGDAVIFAKPLIIGEEESLIFADRTTDCAPKLTAVE